MVRGGRRLLLVVSEACGGGGEAVRFVVSLRFPESGRVVHVLVLGRGEGVSVGGSRGTTSAADPDCGGGGKG